jgi:transposase
LASDWRAIGKLLIRMLIVGYCFGTRSERRLYEEVHLNLADRWFSRLGFDGAVPDHSTFSKNPHGRFRDSDLLRKVFETTVRRCLGIGGTKEGLKMLPEFKYHTGRPHQTSIASGTE